MFSKREVKLHESRGYRNIIKLNAELEILFIKTLID
jgi:hypothetical protein